MRIRLLNNGGYAGMENVVFPVEVDSVINISHYRVSNDEMQRIGANMNYFIDPNDPWWPFIPEAGECEVIEE